MNIIDYVGRLNGIEWVETITQCGLSELRQCMNGKNGEEKIEKIYDMRQ